MDKQDLAQDRPERDGEMKMFLILSISGQYMVSGTISKEERAELSPQHKEYHRPSHEQDRVLVKAMIRPSPGLPRGARCMIMQAPSKEMLEAWMLENPLMKYDAHRWDIREISPDGGMPEFFGWLNRNASPAAQ